MSFVEEVGQKQTQWMLAFIRGSGLLLIRERGKVRVKDPKQSKFPAPKTRFSERGKSVPYTPQGSHRHQGPLPISESKDFFVNRLAGLGSLVRLS